MSEKTFVDVAIIAALEEENEELYKFFPPEDDISSDELQVFRMTPGELNCTVILVLLPRMGKSEANLATRKVLEKFDVGLFACVGIGGGVSKDLKLGDVCYSGPIIDITEHAKVKDGAPDGGKADGKVTISLSPTSYETPKKLWIAFNFFRTKPTLRNAYDAWADCCAQERHRLIDEHQVKSVDGWRDRPTTKSGTIFCGVVVQSQEFKKKLLEIDRKGLAVEMEVAGVLEAALSGASTSIQTPVISIRGVSDFADTDKNQLEDTSGGVVRQAAAFNAASFLKEVLKTPDVEAYLGRRKAECTQEIGRAHV